MKKKNYLAHIYNQADTIIEIRVKSADKVIIKDVIPTKDTKRLTRTLLNLELKGLIDLGSIRKGSGGWFE